MRNVILAALLILISSSGCETGPKSGRGFTLPQGDIAQGKETFQRLNCHACHIVDDIGQLQPLTGEPDLTIALGGDVARIQTYGELVTSIINPSHRLSRGHQPEDVQTEEGTSKMPIYNDMMTVTELTDLVAYLQSQYRLRPYPETPYVPYY